MVHRVEKEPRLRTSCLLRRGKKNFKYISKFLGFQIIYVNFRLLSPTDSGRAGRSVVGNWNFRLMSVAHQKLDVGPDFGRKFGALGGTIRIGGFPHSFDGSNGVNRPRGRICRDMSIIDMELFNG